MIFEGPGMKNINVSAVKAKREFTELLGRVAVGRETFTITRHGKPVAVLAPTAPAEGLQALKGWLAARGRSPIFTKRMGSAPSGDLGSQIVSD